MELLLSAYASGVFPMAETREAQEIFWVQPEKRGILPLESFHISKSLKRFLKKCPFDIRMNTAFKEVITRCAERKETWINDMILDAYCTLHRKGFAHSFECFENSELVGGLYGVSLGKAFFGESMFSKRTNASKAALCALVGWLKLNGFALLDTQFITPHLKTFGGIEITQEEYLILLNRALTQ